MRRDLRRWEDVYNTIRPHQALDYKTPLECVTLWKQQQNQPSNQVVLWTYWTSTDTTNGGAPGEPMPLDEAIWAALESGTARLLPASAGADGNLANLFASVTGEFRRLHRDLALFTRAPTSFLYQGQAIVRAMRLLERSLRAGQKATSGPWRLGREDGSGEDGQVFSQLTVVHAAGGSAKRQDSLVLVRRPGAPASSLYPLPFDAAVLEESDVTGRSVTLVIERDESDAVFVGCLTMLRDKPTGNPTDSGVLLRQDGTLEWSGGHLARQALEESARLEVAGRRPTEQLPAREAPAILTQSTAAALRKPSSRPASRPRRGSTLRGANAEPKQKCRKCGASLVTGARFCASCGESTAKHAAPPVSSPSRAAGRCRQYGAALSPDARFCSSCGAPAGAEPARRASCVQCGALLRTGARFCPSCGARAGAQPIAQPPRAKSCGVCGADLRPGARFCRRCGTPQR